MATIIWCILLFIFPFPFTFIACVISEKINAGSAGAAIPGALVGIASFFVCWGAVVGILLTKMFL